MNSSFGKPNKGSSGSLNNFEFDLGIGHNSNNRTRSLKDQKNQTSSSSFSTSSYSTSFAQSRPNSSSNSWTQNKPSWTHQPSPNQTARPVLSNPTSMVGDISGKSWNSMAPSNSGIGIVDKNPSLFGDLVGSALGQGKNNSNVPLKNAAPIKNATPAPAASSATKSSFSMGNLGHSLPKTGAPMKSSNWGSSNFGGYSNSAGNSGSSGNLGGPSMRSGGSVNVNKDPFGSLVDFSSKKEMAAQTSGNVRAGMSTGKSGVDDDSFGAFQNASKSSRQSVPLSQSSVFDGNSGGLKSSSGSKMDDFGNFEIPVGDFGSQTQAPSKSNGVDPLDALFTSSSASATAAPMGSGGSGSEPFSEVDDWNLGSEFGGNDMGDGGTTELDGLPPPPSGVTASAAKNKGLDIHKQGQHADAIKWLSWALVLLEKAGDNAATMDVLSCRASCYKEVGEYKKAIADCTKILADDDSNVSVLLQRALLYESTEKYKLGAEDLRTVLKIDPGNRLARSTIHRLTKMVD